MSRAHLGAAVAALILVPAAHSQAERVATVERIVLFDGTLPDLDSLRDAIRTGDATRTHAIAADVQAAADARRAEFRAALEALDGRVLRSWWIVDGALVSLPPHALAALATLPQVRAVHENTSRAPGDMPILTSTNFSNHNADSVHARNIRGAGVTVAVVDSGLDENMAGIGRPHRTFFLQGNPNNQTGGGIGGSRMLANRRIGALPPDDPIDHGTRVAGVAIGAKWNALPESDDGHAPESRVVGYSLPDIAGGFTVLATMVQAWQDCTLDAALYGTKVAVISYDGTNDALSPEQAAMDACVDLADVFIAAMAGNQPGSQFYYQGATNVVSVGAVLHDTRAAAGFSARGPLVTPGLPSRVYPTCVANGDLIDMPSANAEASFATRSGTSYSAPQVAGAAALFRSVLPNANADETRAALLATLEDARGPNPLPNDSAAIGRGYLRDDRLVDLAQNRIRGTITRGRVDIATPVWTTTVAVTAGEAWTAALAWSRRNVSRTLWANLDLRVTQNGRVLASSTGAVDTHEFCAFSAPSTGTVQIEVVAIGFETGRIDQAFGVAAARLARPQVESYGIGCEGARPAPQSVLGIEPLGASASFANSSSSLLLGDIPHRAMQWIDTPGLNTSFSADGIAFRVDNAAGTWPRSWVELSMTLSLTERVSSSMITAFAANTGRLRTPVIARKVFVLPSQPAPNANAQRFDVVLPFDRPFDRLYDPFLGGTVHSLVIDVSTYATSAGGLPLVYPLDAVSNLGSARTLWAPSPSATSGQIIPGLATVFGLATGIGNGITPTLAARGVPALGATITLDVAGAKPSAPLALILGASNTTSGGAALPLGLAAIGAPGCYLLASLDFSFAASANASGAASFPLPIPAALSFRGAHLYQQAFAVDLGANQLGLSATAGLHVVTGQ